MCSNSLLSDIQNKNLISNAYVTGTSTSALSWNFIIDYLNMAIYTIGGRCFLSLVTRPKTWMDLVKSFQLLEENLSSPEIYAERRRVGVKAIIYITVSVRKREERKKKSSQGVIRIRLISCSSFTDVVDGSVDKCRCHFE